MLNWQIWLDFFSTLADYQSPEGEPLSWQPMKIDSPHQH